MRWARLDPCRSNWEQALRLPPKTIAETCLWELQTYYQLPPQAVVERCRTASRRIAEAWRRAAPQSSEDVDAFYRQPLDYAFDLLWWHSFMAGDRNFLNILPASRYAYRDGARRTLDFGGGVGSHALVMSVHGLDVELADVSNDLLAFAAWRAQIRSKKVRIIRLDREHLEGLYDFVVATDVLEHLPAPARTLEWFCEHLKDGGLLFINMPRGLSADAPQHISFWGEQLVVEAGLEEVMQFGDVAVLYRKVGPVQARGAPPRYRQAGLVSRRALMRPISPALWWMQTRQWNAAGRTAWRTQRDAGC